jgi:threonine/homoserine/homoserine lactone efflux protein
VADLLAFVGVSLVVIVTPGQDTILTLRNTILGGRPGGMWTAVGVAAGQATWTLATAAGLGALLGSSAGPLLPLKLFGGCYLVVLGVQSLLHARRSWVRPMPIAAAEGLRSGPFPLPWLQAFRQGLLSNLGNPKMLAFFTSLLPPFATSFTGLITLGLLFSSLTLAWLTLYALVASRLSSWLTRPAVACPLEGLTGMVLIVLGLHIATDW